MFSQDMELMDIIRKASRFLSYHLDCHPGIGCEEFVNVRRLLKILSCDLYNTFSKGCFLMARGSRGEGLDFGSSDFDYMLTFNNVIVVQPNDEIPQRDISKIVLVMDNTGCRHGFTLLRLHQVGMIQHVPNMDAFTEINGSMYMSSVAFISSMLGQGHYVHGPCLSVNHGYFEGDLAPCFHCRPWPDDLTDFRYRTLHCAWPSRQLVNYIVRNGCHFVAIGDKHSSLFAIQWRISFAQAEKSLVMSFNHVQLKTYALLKIFLKECIERDQNVMDLLCSYFMKTVVFHAIEHSASSMWVDDNIVQCFWFCFTILLEFVQTGYCPNYFVLTHNMFLSNVTGDNRRRLLHVLSRYNGIGWTCLFQCPSLQSLHQTIQVSLSMYPLSNYQDLNEAEFQQDAYIWNILDTSNVYQADIATFLKSVNKVFLKCSDDNQCDIALLLFIKAITQTSSNIIADLTRTHNNSNKNVYRQIRKHKRLLHLSSATFACGGLLSLATFYYNVGCYNRASEVATRAGFACQQRALIQRGGTGREYKEEICGKGYSLLQKAKRSFVHWTNMHETFHKLYPPELNLEVRESDPSSVMFPSLPYAVFLLVLSTYRLGNTDQSRIILGDLLSVRNNQIYGVCYYPILHNLVGICHQLLGDKRQAIQAFGDSCRQLSDNPAAAIRIAELRRPQREERDSTDIDALDYCNIPCHYQSYESIDNDDDDRLYYHKTMYNTDPASFVNLCSWL